MLFRSRSADYPVGVPFDTTQYAVLTYLFARHLGVHPGILTHVMADSHIYANQLEGVAQQIKQYTGLRGIIKERPKFRFIADAPKDFWDITLDDIDVIDYDPMPAIKYEVAV